MSSYTITLKNCGFFARHGFFAEEAFLGQRFFVDAEFDVTSDGAVENDELEGTVDYGAAFKVIEEVVVDTRRRLIEALAHDVARALLQRFEPITRVKIAVRKPSAPIAGMLDYAQVTVELAR